MCGIVVGLAVGKLNKKDEITRQKLLRYFTTEMMLLTEERGEDATGITTLFDDGNYYGVKRGDKVSEFLAKFGEGEERFGSVLKVWREHEHPVRVYLGHCRKGTGGTSYSNENNHPIKIGNLVGIHNGIIHNDDVIFEKLGCKRDGKVDSEAIFRLFYHFTNKGKEPFTMDMVQEVVNRLQGHFAVTLFNADNTEQVPVFRDGRPVEIIFIRKYGIVFLISLRKFFDTVHFQYERFVNYYHKDIGRTKLPSFLGKDDIEEKTLIDDSAMIFDLSSEIGPDTKIDDLGEWKKVTGANKIWRSSWKGTSSMYSNGMYYERCSQGPATPTGTNKSNSGSSNNDKKARRVYDSITRKYIVKAGDKEASEGSEIIMDVDKDENGKNKDKVKVTDKRTAHAAVNNKNKVESSDVVPKNDQDSPIQDVVGDLKDVKDIKPIELPAPKAKDNSVILEEALESAVIEVPADTYEPEVVAAAEKALRNLPKKGFSKIEEVIELADIKDEKTMEDLGPLVLANRLFKEVWRSGYMAGRTDEIAESTNRNSRSVEKDRKREKHIANLKALTLILSKYFRSNMSSNNEVFNENVKRKLAGAVINTTHDIDPDQIRRILNNYEKEKLREVLSVVEEAHAYEDILVED